MGLRRSLAVLLLIALPAVVGCAPSAGVLTPHIALWEHQFALEWTPEQRGGQPAVSGHLTNHGNFTAANVQLLVDAVDAGGRITGQRVSWLGRPVAPGVRTYFDAPAPPPARSYRVSVYAFEVRFDDSR